MTATLLEPRARTTPLPLLGHTPALDGLRGVALLLVLTYHFTGASGPLPGGWAGVDVFFALSGFLITALLLDEHRVYGRIDLPRFYARRALRLLPALFAMLAVWVVLLLTFHDTTWFAATPSGDGSGDPVDISRALAQVGLVLTYGANWLYALGSGAAPLGHLWSLAVEEQFYLLWPLAVLALLALPAARRRWPVLLLIAVSAALPTFLYDGGAGKNRIYFGTDTRAVGLLIGAAAALAWHHRRGRYAPARLPAVRAWVGLAFLAALAVTLTNVPAKFTLAPTLLGLAVTQVVTYVVDHPGSALARGLTPRALVWVGQRSYGLYLWHYLWATWTHPLPLSIGLPLGVAGTLVCAVASWRLVERPALRYATRLRKGHGPSTVTHGPCLPALEK